MTPAWLREEQPDLASDRILDAAEKVFIERGVSPAGMARIAESAGCSRGTLYRYFKNRDELHRAYVNREALRLIDRMSGDLQAISDPRERLVEVVLRSVREVRNNPATAAWFAPAESGRAARISRGSELIDTLAQAFLNRLPGANAQASRDPLTARWLVRVIVSLLSMPGEDEAEERALVERFVAPVVLGES